MIHVFKLGEKAKNASMFLLVTQNCTVKRPASSPIMILMPMSSGSLVKTRMEGKAKIS